MSGMHMPRADMEVKLGRQMQIKSARHERDQAQGKSQEETNEIKKFPVHETSPLFADLLRVAPFSPLASGFNTCRRRSASFGVSRIAPSSTMHPRELSWRANSSKAALSSGSRRKRSAPLISHRSRRSSKVRTSDISSAW